jgi:hypothetical protein
MIAVCTLHVTKSVSITLYIGNKPLKMRAFSNENTEELVISLLQVLYRVSPFHPPQEYHWYCDGNEIVFLRTIAIRRIPKATWTCSWIQVRIGDKRTPQSVQQQRSSNYCGVKLCSTSSHDATEATSFKLQNWTRSRHEFDRPGVLNRQGPTSNSGGLCGPLSLLIIDHPQHLVTHSY